MTIKAVESVPGPGSGSRSGLEDPASPASADCWHRIGVSGDRSCPELASFIHCRNCPVFAAAARTFFDRPAPEGYLAEQARWLAEPVGLSHRDQDEDAEEDLGHDDPLAQREGTSVLIFRLGEEWLAVRTLAVAEVTTPRPVHRVPHRSNQVFSGLVNLQGQAQLCVSLHGLLGVNAPATAAWPRLVVLRDRDRSETWAFGADEVAGVQRVPRSQWHSVPSTLINPAVGFSLAVLSWKGRSVGLLDEQRVFAALRNLES
jgi:chemotaxis-related protein WspD